MSNAPSVPTSPQRFHCIDAHTCGNPVRLVYKGKPPLEGESMGDKRAHFLAEYDWIRTALMLEPRGHAQMSGSFLYRSAREDCDIGVLFIETSGCLPMCGHGTIGTVTIAIEHNLVDPAEPGVLNLETPAGRVVAHYTLEDDRVRSVRIANIPSFLHSRDLEVDCPELDTVLKVDVSYGGNFYAIVEPQPGYRDLADLPATEIARISPRLRERMNQRYTFEHPDDPRVCGLTHILWTGAPTAQGSDARNAVFYGESAIDRSPCGTGTSARMAQLVGRGRLAVGDRFVHESIIGSQFIGRVEAAAQVGDYPAIVPSIEGWARIYGHNVITVDPADDPYWQGFSVT